MVVLTIVAITGVALLSVASASYATSKKNSYYSTANYAAESGITKVVSQLYDDRSTATDFSPEQALFDNITSGKATFSTKVSPGPNSDSINIESTGRFYERNTDSTPIVSQTVKATATKSTSPSNYPVYAGAGGITVGSGTRLLAQKIMSDGKVVLPSDTAYIGAASELTNLNVSNVRCTNGTVYPSICPQSPTRNEPLEINATTPQIYGTVCANNQTNAINISTMAGSGLSPNCSPSRTDIREIDRSSILASAPDQFPAATCSSGAASPAKGTYNGDVNISGGCQLTLPEIVYIKGDLNISGASTRMYIPDSYGSKPPMIIVTGKININGSSLQTNTYGVGARFISFASPDTSGCSLDASCVKLSDQSIKQSSQDINAVSCTNNCNLPETQLVAYFGKVTLGTTSFVGSIAGEKVQINPGSGSVRVRDSSSSVDNIVQVTWLVTDIKRGSE
jgi:hypothetical protein